MYKVIILRLMCRSLSVTSSIPICLHLRLALDINASLDTNNFLVTIAGQFYGIVLKQYQPCCHG